MPARPSNDDRYTVPGLMRGLRLLQLFSRERPVLTLSELAELLALSPSTVFRLIHTLEADGFLERVPDTKSYRPGPRVFTLGFDCLNALDLVEFARPHLNALRDASEANAHLGIRDGREVVYLVRVQARTRLVSSIQVGSRLPAHATSMGRVLLTDLDDTEIEQLYRSVDLRAFSEQTATTVSALKALIAADRARGFVISRSAYDPGVASIAAPVRDVSGRVAAAINIVGTEWAMENAGLETTLKAAVMDAARNISSALGYRPEGRGGSAVLGAPRR